MNNLTKEEAKKIVNNYNAFFIRASSYYSDGSHTCFSSNKETFLNLIDESDIVARMNPDYPHLEYDFCVYAIGIWMFVGIKNDDC